MHYVYVAYILLPVYVLIYLNILFTSSVRKITGIEFGYFIYELILLHLKYIDTSISFKNLYK